MVRDADVPDAAFFFPGAQKRHDHVHVDEAVALHEVDLIAPQALPRLLKAARGMAVVGEVLSGRPDLVANEHLVIDAQRRGGVADANLGHAIERRGVDDTPAALPETTYHLTNVIAGLPG
jgi:hypothetical protein